MKKMLKKAVVCALCVVCLFGLLGIASLGSRYSRNAVVTQVWSDEVEVEDEQGNLWVFYGDGFKRGQNVKLVMSDNETVGITDDIILDVKEC